MRNLYLVRHGKVEFPGGVPRCIGRTEAPLGEEGRRQAMELQEYFRRHPVEYIYSSPLGRCVETAKMIANGRWPVKIEKGLSELDMGEWENIPRKELRKSIEEEPKTGEGRAAGLYRFEKAVRQIADQTRGDILCVAHAGINCCFLSKLLRTPLESSRAIPQPYGGISRITIDEGGNMQAEEVGVMPKSAPNVQECEAIWEHYHMPGQVKEHCQEVWRQAQVITERLSKAGCRLDAGVIRGAALLHDIAKEKPDHAEEGAKILRREGYPRIAEIIRRHHDLSAGSEEEIERRGLTPDELEVVYLADKLVKGASVVSLQERFADSRKRCEQAQNPQEALAVHERRFREAKSVEHKIMFFGGYTDAAASAQS